MKNLVAEIVQTLKNASYPVTVTVIRPSYSKAHPVYPMIIVGEIDNSTKLALKGEERWSTIRYQIDIFSKDMVIDYVPISGIEVCRKLGHIVDLELNEKYGMTRNSAVELPDVNDATVSRLTLRYTGILDIKTDYTYR
jgi:hypothetical protein